MTQAKNDLKWMLSSDQQFPYQDDKMIELWFKVMKWFKPDVVDYLGDTDDQACYSKYNEGLSSEFLALHKTDSKDLIVIGSDWAKKDYLKQIGLTMNG